MKHVDRILICIAIVLCVLRFMVMDHELDNLRKSVKLLEMEKARTVEIIVERTFDEDMRMYDYKLK